MKSYKDENVSANTDYAYRAIAENGAGKSVPQRRGDFIKTPQQRRATWSAMNASPVSTTIREANHKRSSKTSRSSLPMRSTKPATAAPKYAASRSSPTT
ncbi:MAG: hypothetical protein R3A10_00400 [Caldilineaceae bacterium]